MRSFLPVFAILALAALGAAGCDDDVETPTTPTPPTSSVTESFSGTVSRNGATTFPFSVGGNGQVTATLATFAAASGTLPDGSVIGISLGNWNGTTCQIVLANDKAIQGTFVTGTMSRSGDLCLRVYDSTGELATTATFKVDVVHP
jgi:hypothetical protein